MKKHIAIALVALLLSACGSSETFETVLDDHVQPALAQVRQVSVSLPPEAASPALESENGCVYICDGYEIYQQTLPSGDLGATIRCVTGYDESELTVLESRQEEWKRYDFVWASAGDQGDLIGKGCILDDGSYHYVLTVLGDAAIAEEYQAVWQEMLSGFTLS